MGHRKGVEIWKALEGAPECIAGDSQAPGVPKSSTPRSREDWVPALWVRDAQRGTSGGEKPTHRWWCVAGGARGHRLGGIGDRDGVLAPCSVEGARGLDRQPGSLLPLRAGGQTHLPWDGSLETSCSPTQDPGAYGPRSFPAFAPRAQTMRPAPFAGMS